MMLQSWPKLAYLASGKLRFKNMPQLDFRVCPVCHTVLKPLLETHVSWGVIPAFQN